VIGMPVQKHNRRPVARPSGLVPPPADLAGVTELRLHGVGGTTPENLLGDVAPQLVAGDNIAGFFRTADLVAPGEGAQDTRHVEAYSWGGLTSRSVTRVLWLLLFPFALVNIGGWMCSAKVWQKPWRFYAHRGAMRLAALGLTINLLLLAALITMDVTAYQCANQGPCLNRWWLKWLGYGGLPDLPAARVLIGSLVPLLVIVGLLLLTRRSVQRYENTAPPYSAAPVSASSNADSARSAVPAQGGAQATAQPGHRHHPVGALTPARPGVGLSDKDFWNGGRSIDRLGRLHAGVGLGFLGWLIAFTVHAMPQSSEAGWLSTAVTVVALATFAAGAGLLMPSQIPDALSWMVVAAGAVTYAGAAVYASLQPPVGVDVLTRAHEPLPGMRVAANWAYGICLGAVILVLVTSLWGGREKGTFWTAAPFVTTTIGTVLLNGVGLGLMIRAGSFLGTVTQQVGPETPIKRIYIYPVIYALTPYLTLLPTLILAAFAVFACWRLVTAGRKIHSDAIDKEYEKEAEPAPPSRWNRSVLSAESGARPGRRPKWTRAIARGRVIATLPLQADKLLSTMTGFALATVVYSWIAIWGFQSLPWSRPWILTLSTWLAALLPLAVVQLLLLGWRGLESRRRLGVLWDVGTFWPRAYHPFAPPSYAERAVPELQHRLLRIHDADGQVLLAAHSQGSIIAAAALVQRDRLQLGDLDLDGKIGLVTFGCPLSKLYGWGFPAYFGPQTMADLESRTWRWRNFFYATDYIGGPVDGTSGTVNVPLIDPASSWYIYGQDPPALGRHSGYWTDPRVWTTIDDWTSASKSPAGRTNSGGAERG
jgi:hypothetical protein